jgi:hypothetical protein
VNFNWNSTINKNIKQIFAISKIELLPLKTTVVPSNDIKAIRKNGNYLAEGSSVSILQEMDSGGLFLPLLLLETALCFMQFPLDQPHYMSILDILILVKTKSFGKNYKEVGLTAYLYILLIIHNASICPAPEI